MPAKPSFSPEQLHQRLCRSWCSDLVVEPVGDSYAVRLPLDWPTGEVARGYVQTTNEGQLIVSDWGGVRAELFAHGVHRSPIVDHFALSKGFSTLGHGELVRTVSSDDNADLAGAVMGLAEIAAVALAEITAGEFKAPSMLIRPAWENILREHATKRSGVQIGVSGKGYELDRQHVFLGTLVAVHEGRAVVASPIVGARKNDFTRLYYLLNSGVDTMRGVLPVVRMDRPDAFDNELRDLGKIAQERGRFFAHVPVIRSGEQFEQRTKTYPAVAELERGGVAFDMVLEQVLTAA